MLTCCGGCRDGPPVKLEPNGFGQKLLCWKQRKHFIIRRGSLSRSFSGVLHGKLQFLQHCSTNSAHCIHKAQIRQFRQHHVIAIFLNFLKKAQIHPLSTNGVKLALIGGSRPPSPVSMKRQRMHCSNCWNLLGTWNYKRFGLQSVCIVCGFSILDFW